MKISEIVVYTYDVKYAYGTYTMSGGRTTTGQPSIVVQMHCDDGSEGWAETAPLGSDYLPSSFSGELAAVKELGEQILGLDPGAPAVVAAVMERAMMSGMAAKAVLEFACWDIFGKSLNVPTHSLFGGCLTKEPRAFGVVGVAEPDVAVKKAEAELEKGYKALQLKAGDNPHADARRVKAICEALPDTIDLWVDANGGWNLGQALTFARALGPSSTVTLEQPCRSLSDCAEVGCRTGLPIVLDESIVTMADLVAAHSTGITGINLKTSRVGGYTKAKSLRDAAVALEMMVVIDDTWGGALTTAQNLQLAVTTPAHRLRAVDLFAEWTTPLIAEIPRLQSNGCISHTTSPGNGFGPVNLDLLGDPLFRLPAEDNI